MKKLFGLILVMLALAGLPARADLRVEFKKDDHPVRSQNIGKIEYFSLSDFARALGGNTYYNPINKKLVLTLQDRQFKFSLFSPYIQVDQEVYNLTHPVEISEGDFFAPLAPLLDIFNSTLSVKIDWQPGDRDVKIAERDLDITSVRTAQKANGVLLEIYLSRPLGYEVFTAPDNWLHITFADAKINPGQLASQAAGPSVSDMKAYQFENSCQLSFKLKRTFNKHEAEMREDPLRLRVSLIDTTLSRQIANPAFEDKANLQNNDIDVIVIDPGHGGEDTGAKGPRGVMEKDVVLQIAKKTAEELRKKGFQVVLTRDEDVFIPLADRTALANQKGADLFISIHANAARRKAASGSQTYFLARAKNDDARAVAALENSSIRFEQPDADPEQLQDLDFILLDMVQNEFLKESQELATFIQDRMEKYLPIPNRGVDQAGFFVLNKAYMPSVLVETAFISNSNEAKLLQKGTFQGKIAASIVEAVLEFKKKYEHLGRAQ